MNLTAHPVAEELMALLDGELPESESRAVTSHLEACTECGELARQFRAVSASLNGWAVQEAPQTLEERVKAEANEAPVADRRGWWGAISGRPWLAVGGGLVTMLLVIGVGRAVLSPWKAKRMMAFHAESDTRYSQPQTREMNELAATIAPMALRAPQDARAVKGKAEGIVGGAAQAEATTVPMIARTVSLNLVVKDVPAARARLEEILARHQGYAAQLTSMTQENEQRSLQVSLRIPAPALAAALAELRTLGRVQNESQSGEEVTQQHADLAARLKNSRETEERLRDLLAQRTGKIEDVLQVEEEMARVRGEIEEMEAQKEALEHRVDYASVDLHLAEEFREQFTPASASVSTQVRNAFVSGMRSASGTLLGMVLFLEEDGPVILIWLVILGVPGWLVWRRYRRVRARG